MRADEAHNGDGTSPAQGAAFFDLDRTMVNLNNGGCSPAPTHVLDQMIRDLRFSNELPTEHMWRVLEPRVESVRRDLASEFGCASIVVTLASRSFVTASVMAALNSWPLNHLITR